MTLSFSKYKSSASSSENNLHIFSCPKCNFSCVDLIVKYWYTLACLSIHPVKQKTVQHFCIGWNWFVLFFKQRFRYFIESKAFGIRCFEIFVHCITSVSVLIWCPNRQFFRLYRLFILNQCNCIKLAAVILFATIFNTFSTSFRFVLRTENNGCLITLLAIVMAFSTQTVVCSSACIWSYEKIPFLFCTFR